MANNLPAPAGAITHASLFAPFADPHGGPLLSRIAQFGGQPPLRRFIPAIIGISAVGGALLAWSALSPSPQRVLYAELADSDRAGVAAALDQAGITYGIDNGSGALSVAEGDYYRARMLVASDGALATPETGDQMLDKLPIGASRTLEGERLRSAREHDLQFTIMEIDGVESARVHLAQGEKSVFIRQNVPPSASIMVRLKPGRQLTDGQVIAIVNLVAASVPGLAPDAVRVVDQHGRLLSESDGIVSDRLELQSRMESKLRDQVAQLLRPILGEQNFTTEAQVELDMDEVTSARESYDKDGVVRSETQAQSQSTTAGPAMGVPGVLSNTPPPATQATPGAPQGMQSSAGTQGNGESSSTRTYELGREVAVANTRPGGLKRLSIAVAISSAAMKGAKAKDLADLEALVSATVGANAQRGDQIKIVTRTFQASDESEEAAFYETPWFALLVRNGAAVLAVLLVLLLGVRPITKAVKGTKGQPSSVNDLATHDDDSNNGSEANQPAEANENASSTLAHPAKISGPEPFDVDMARSDLLSQQVGLAQRLVAERPDSALAALRQMINETASNEKAKAA